ncbi:phosphoribosylformylglycinamidine synthase subunit PurQ, partial [Acinetobacter baumannii]
DPETHKRLEGEGRVVVRYCDERGAVTAESNPNGALANIAGICDERRRVVAMMPHPERLYEPVLGGSDGRGFFESMAAALVG